MTKILSCEFTVWRNINQADFFTTNIQCMSQEAVLLFPRKCSFHEMSGTNHGKLLCCDSAVGRLAKNVHFLSCCQNATS